MQPTAEARVYFRKAGVSALQASNTSFVATGSGAVSDRLSFGAVSYRYVPLPLLNDVPQAALSLVVASPFSMALQQPGCKGFCPQQRRQDT